MSNALPKMNIQEEHVLKILKTSTTSFEEFSKKIFNLFDKDKRGISKTNTVLDIPSRTNGVGATDSTVKIQDAAEDDLHQS